MTFKESHENCYQGHADLHARILHKDRWSVLKPNGNKKTIIMLLCTIFSVALIMTGCAEKDIYSGYKYSEYVTLPDYDSYEYSEYVSRVKDEDVQKEIEKRLDAAADTETLYEGICEEGDTINISFSGMLKAGFSVDSMNSDDFRIESLGNDNMIEGFQEGIIGHKVGDNFVLNLKFPDPYYSDETLSGRLVDFDITILSKTIKKPAEYDEAFIKKDSKGKAKDDEEYREYIRSGLEEADYNNQMDTFRTELYDKILAETESPEPIAELVDYEYDKLMSFYKNQAEREGYADDFDTFLMGFFTLTEEEFYEMLDEYADTTVSQKMIIMALAEKENVKVSDREYEKKKQEIFEASELSSEEAFEKAYGMNLDDYCSLYNARVNLLLEKTLTSIYKRHIG